MRTPWGESQSYEHHANGIDFYITTSHGGFAVSEKNFNTICRIFPSVLKQNVPTTRTKDKNTLYWFEEDCMYSYVVIAFKDCFTKKEYNEALHSLANWYPDDWEKLTGKKLEKGMSIIRDRNIFEKEHRNDYVVTSASFLDYAPNIVFITSSKISDNSEKFYIMRAEDYDVLLSENNGRIVIDEHSDSVEEVQKDFRTDFCNWAEETCLDQCRDIYIARGCYKEKTAEGYPVVCSMIELGGAAPETRKEILVNKDNWEKRPMQTLLCVADDGTTTPIEYANVSTSPRP